MALQKIKHLSEGLLTLNDTRHDFIYKLSGSADLSADLNLNIPGCRVKGKSMSLSYKEGKHVDILIYNKVLSLEMHQKSGMHGSIFKCHIILTTVNANSYL